MSRFKVDNNYIIRILLAISIIVCLLMWNPHGINGGKTLLLLALGINLLLIYYSRKFKPLLIMMVFFFSYIFNLIDYYWNGVDISGGYQIFDIIEYYNYTLKIHVYFLAFLLASFPVLKHRIYLRERLKNKQSTFLFYLTACFMLFIYLFGSSGQTIFEAGGYGSSGTTALGGTSIFEYFIVLVPLGFIFSSENRRLRYILWILVLLYCAKSILFGYRNQVIQVGLVLLCLLDSSKVKYRHILAIGIIPVYLLLLFGQIRQNPFILFTENISNIILIPFQNLFDNFGNQNDVFYSSVRMFGLVQIGELSAYDRLLSFGSNIMALVTPYSILPDVANLAAYKKDVFGAGGGGLISMYWYVFLGILGPCIIGFGLGYILTRAINSKNIYFILYLLLVLSTYLRWFAYNQISLFKISAYGALFYFALIMLVRIIKLFNTNNIYLKKIN